MITSRLSRLAMCLVVVPALGRTAADAQDAATPNIAQANPVIGRVEGHEVRASDVLDGLETAPAFLGGALSQSQRTRAHVRRRLREVLVELLFLSDAEQALSADQRAGIANYEKELRQRLIMEFGQGDARRADRELAQREGRGLEQMVETLRRDAIVKSRLNAVIRARVVVTDDDVRRYYEARRDEYHTPDQWTVRMIYTKDPDTADRFDRALASGTGFDEIAADPANIWHRRGVQTLAADDLVEPLRRAVLLTEPGRHSSLIEHRGGFAWIAVEAYEPARNIPLVDASADIRTLITERRLARLQEEHIERLLAESEYTQPEQMIAAAMVVAEQRLKPRDDPGS